MDGGGGGKDLKHFEIRWEKVVGKPVCAGKENVSIVNSINTIHNILSVI